MDPIGATQENFTKKLPLHLAIVGGGDACKSFMELIQQEPFPYLEIRLVGVCDIDPNAEGLQAAKASGIFTTNDFRELFDIQNLDGVIELTGRREVLLELIRHRPKRVAVIEHNIGRFLRTFFDLSQRLKSAEQQIVREKMITDFLIQQTNERIVVLNTDFTVEEANEAYLNNNRKPKKEVIGGLCYQVMFGLKAPCSSSQPNFYCPMLETLKTGESAHVIHEDSAPGGEKTYCDLVTYPVKNSSGEVIKVIEIRRDITEEFSARWEKRAQELKADLQKLVQEDRMISLGKLAASCVHEINNPIQGLLTFSHLMKETLSESDPNPSDLEQFKEYLSLMSNELERCGSIVSGLLSFSRESTMEYKTVDMNEIIDTVIMLTRHKMKLQEITLETELFPETLSINGDTNHLQQCFLNLIFNAIEAMPRGGALTIKSWLGKSDHKAWVTFQDAGYGITADDLSHIFDPFFTTKDSGEGTGLGLSIVYGVVKNHGGNISVDSEVKKGTTFKLSFPVV